ncbi:MAG: MarR family winged helix-turn-helix transcriptional regulator [Hyphomicrobiales bacterium]|nr:MarR family winged helix-turn-helix transcriptional regulator [Hyphomicrobiales bacterium]
MNDLNPDPMAVANCTCFNLRKAARSVTQLYDGALKPSGLRATQFTLLCAIENNGPAGITELARVLVTDRTTLTRNLKPLIEKELIESVDSADRRERPVALTPKGHKVLSGALPLWRDAQTRVTNILGRGNWARLLGDLNDAVRQTRAM